MEKFNPKVMISLKVRKGMLTYLFSVSNQYRVNACRQFIATRLFICLLYRKKDQEGSWSSESNAKFGDYALGLSFLTCAPACQSSDSRISFSSALSTSL